MARQYNIKQLKKELGISNKEIAGFFGLTPISYANSSAKKRYENALCKFYTFVGSKHEQATIEDVKNFKN